MLKKIIAAGLAAGFLFSSLSVTAEAAAMDKNERIV